MACNNIAWTGIYGRLFQSCSTSKCKYSQNNGKYCEGRNLVKVTCWRSNLDLWIKKQKICKIFGQKKKKFEKFFDKTKKIIIIFFFFT